MTKISKIASITILALLQLLFLISIFYDLTKDATGIIFISIIYLFGSIGIIKISKSLDTDSSNNLLLILFVCLGGLFTYYLYSELNIGAVIASALVGTIASFLPLLGKNNKWKLLDEIPKAIYCGSFVGMTAPFIAQGYSFIFSAGITAGILYVLSKKTFIGVGGKLGTLAFGGVVITFFFLFFKI